jgi:hypothetical protein
MRQKPSGVNDAGFKYRARLAILDETQMAERMLMERYSFVSRLEK